MFEVKPAIKSDSPQSEVAQGIDRIPVSMDVDGDEVGCDVHKDEKSGTPRRDTSKMKMTFGTHSEIGSQCQCIQVRAFEKMCACCASGEVFCVHPPSRAWQLLQPGRETLRN